MTTQRSSYRGATRSAVEAAFREDAQTAQAAGYVPGQQEWVTEQGGSLRLDVTYEQSAGGAPTASPAVGAGRPSMVQYKILTQKDRWFGGKFDPLKVEEALNAYAQEGWRVAATATASFPAFFSGNREELIVILERQVA